MFFLNPAALGKPKREPKLDMAPHMLRVCWGWFLSNRVESNFEDGTCMDPVMAPLEPQGYAKGVGINNLREDIKKIVASFFVYKHLHGPPTQMSLLKWWI